MLFDSQGNKAPLSVVRGMVMDGLSELAQGGDKTAQAMITLCRLLHAGGQSNPDSQASETAQETDSETVAPASEDPPAQYAKPRTTNYDWLKRGSLNN